MATPTPPPHPTSSTSPATVWEAFISDVQQGEDDPETLIAYSIYKSDIFATYKKGLADGKTPAAITNEIDLIKLFTRTDKNYRNTFRVRATTFSARYEQAARKKITSDLWEKIEQQNVQRIGFIKKVGNGIWDGAMSILATAFMVIILTGFFSLFVSPETRIKVATAGIKSAVSALYGDVPFLNQLTEDSEKGAKPKTNP